MVILVGLLFELEMLKCKPVIWSFLSVLPQPQAVAVCSSMVAELLLKKWLVAGYLCLAAIAQVH
jgi:hypothetical protein